MRITRTLVLGALSAAALVGSAATVSAALPMTVKDVFAARSGDHLPVDIESRKRFCPTAAPA